MKPLVGARLLRVGYEVHPLSCAILCWRASVNREVRKPQEGCRHQGTFMAGQILSRPMLPPVMGDGVRALSNRGVQSRRRLPVQKFSAAEISRDQSILGPFNRRGDVFAHPWLPREAIVLAFPVTNLTYQQTFPYLFTASEYGSKVMSIPWWWWWWWRLIISQIFFDMTSETSEGRTHDAETGLGPYGSRIKAEFSMWADNTSGQTSFMWFNSSADFRNFQRSATIDPHIFNYSAIGNAKSCRTGMKPPRHPWWLSMATN
ncbi:hypothetical protein C8J57DRAFT_1259787 [Mycena rebaudengoi]|nr:hypothetical protein C8J57DRAFT_1259787 [Mycena rebaudengoi]